MIYSSNHDSLTFFVERVFALRLQWTFSAHAATQRRTRNDGLQKKKFKFVHSAYNLVHCTWSVYFRAIPSLSAPAWAPGQPDTTPGPIPSDDRGTSCDTPADLASLGSAARKSIPTRRLATGLERWNHSFRRSRRKVSAPCVINRY